MRELVEKMSPKITIVIATYNSAKTLEQSIASVIGQTYSNIELVIIDGGSTDNTRDIIRKYEKSISFWVSENDKGIYDAFNKGVQHATGEYIQFLGSDDSLCESTTIEQVADNLSNDVDILSANVWVVDEKTNFQQLACNSCAIEKRKFDGGMIPHPGMFVRREILLEHPFDITYRIAADYLFFLSCYYNNEYIFKFIDLPIVFFSSCGISSTSKVQLREENERIWKQFNINPKNFEGNKIKRLMKAMLKKIGIFLLLKVFINKYIRKSYVLHKCKWPLCRWCKQKES